MLYKMDGAHKIFHQERANRLTYKNMNSYKKPQGSQEQVWAHINKKHFLLQEANDLPTKQQTEDEITHMS